MANKKTRLELTSKSLFFFGLYYFQEFFTHMTPEFHIEMTKALEFNEEDTHKYLLLIMFRESAKTSWAKIKILQDICFARKHFIIYSCFDQRKSEAHLFDVAIQLQTNQRLIQDFGQLFYESGLDDNIKRSKKKSVKEFITSNDIKVKASSTGSSTRGEVFQNYRPDLIALDDFENEKTKRSSVMTDEVRLYIDELLSGMGSSCEVIFLANRIAKNGSVRYIEDKAREGKSDWRILEQPLIEGGEISWRAKFVWTNKERDRINASVTDKMKKVSSVQERKRTLGTRRFNQEYQNIPIPEGDTLIKEEWITGNYYTTLPKLGVLKIIMMDPQAGESKDADYYGICTLAFVPKDEHRYVKSIIKGRTTKLKQAAKLALTWQREDKVEEQRVILVGVEKIMTQVAVYQLILDWKHGKIDFAQFGVDDNNRNIPLQAVQPEGKDKVARLEAHEAAFERGEIHLHHTMKNFTENLAAFPDVEHDDDIDPLIYCLDYSYKSGFASSKVSDYNPSDNQTITGNIQTKKF